MKRSHKNNKRRLTARERAAETAKWVLDAMYLVDEAGCGTPAEFRKLYEASARPVIQRAIQAAVRQALARKERRANGR